MSERVDAISAERLSQLLRDLPEDAIASPADTGQRATLADKVAGRIAHLVRVGNLKPGDALPVETKLSAALGVSRPVLREALKMLAILGITESRQGGAHVITDLSPKTMTRSFQFMTSVEEYDAEEHYHARLVTDAELAMMASVRASDEEVARIADLAKRGQSVLRDPVAFRILDFDFHMAVYDAARSALLSRMAQSLYELGLRWRRVATSNHANIARSVTEHEEIAAAIAARNPARARLAASIHIDTIHRSTVAAMKASRTVNSEETTS